MSKNNIKFEEIHAQFCDFINDCNRFNCFTRSRSNQEEKTRECKEYIEQIKYYKFQAVKAEQEYFANQFFHMQCAVNALYSVLSMWISLKDEEYQKAWNFLIDAQEYTEIALKVIEYEGIINFQKDLLSIEHTVFPSRSVYASPGMTETIGNCSICGSNFALCDHIENKIYMGALCQRINRKIISINHGALVREPRDKRCIITKVSDDDGNMIDYFTWDKTGDKKELSNNDESYVDVVMMNYSGLDVK